jgi:branched-chain amino acid transport system ATP-binding protein
LLALHGTQLSWLQLLRSTSDNRFLGEARKLLESIGLWEKRESCVKALSHGEQRQLEIILCMASKAKLLLLDEPSAGLASSETAVLISMIRAVPRDITIVFCAHDLQLVFSLAERVTILHHGELFAEETPEEVQVDSRVREIYLGR